MAGVKSFAPAPMRSRRRDVATVDAPCVTQALPQPSHDRHHSPTAAPCARCLGRKLRALHVTENHFLRPTVADPQTLESRAREQLDEDVHDGGSVTTCDS
jgi:hypothetical protein